MMARGVPPGAARPSHDMTSKPGSVSAMVGISGASIKRLREETASPRNMPPLIWANADRAGFDHDVEPAAQQVLHDLGITPVRNATQRSAGFDVDQFAGQMVHAAGQVQSNGAALARA